MSADLQALIDRNLALPPQTHVTTLPLLHIVERGLDSATKLLPLIQFESLSREDLLDLTVTIHAAMRELEAATLHLRPILNQITPINTTTKNQ